MIERAPLLIYGAGGMGRELAWLAETCRRQVLAFIDDAEDSPGEVLGIPVMSLAAAAERHPGSPFVSSLGSSPARRDSVARALTAGFELTSLVHPQVLRSRWVDIGPGAVVAAGSILTTNVRIGDNVQINTACTIAHDAVIERDATLGPGVHVSGWVHISEAAQIGTGVSIINGTSSAPLVIGRAAVVGAGACVIGPIPDATTVVGVPARPI